MPLTNWPDRAAELWAPLLQLEQQLPTQRMALIVDEDKPTAIQGEARLANALAQALRQHPSAVSTGPAAAMKQPSRWRQSWQHTPPDLLRITGTGTSAQTAIDLAIERKIPYVLTCMTAAGCSHHNGTGCNRPPAARSHPRDYWRPHGPPASRA